MSSSVPCSKLIVFFNHCHFQNLTNNDLGLLAAQLLGHVMAVTKYITHLNLSGKQLIS